MRVTFHRLLQQDVWQVIEHYEIESGERLANEFYAELMQHVRLCAANPERCHFDSSGLRRANLDRFPYHFLYRKRSHDILILVLRHHTRHPSFGLARKWRA